MAIYVNVSHFITQNIRIEYFNKVYVNIYESLHDTDIFVNHQYLLHSFQLNWTHFQNHVVTRL